MTGSIQGKNGKWYMVISYKDMQNNWKTKWKSTGLSVRVNKKLAEQMLKEELNTLNGDKYVMYSIIVNEFGNTREKNYGNLVSQIKGNPNEWFNDVFTISKLVNIVNQFNVILQSDILNEPIYEDDLDVSNSDSESIDEMSKSWEDKLYKSFDGIDFHPNYEAKTFNWLENNIDYKKEKTLLWIVGAEPKLS